MSKRELSSQLNPSSVSADVVKDGESAQPTGAAAETWEGENYRVRFDDDPKILHYSATLSDRSGVTEDAPVSAEVDLSIGLAPNIKSRPTIAPSPPPPPPPPPPPRTSSPIATPPETHKEEAGALAFSQHPEAVQIWQTLDSEQHQYFQFFHLTEAIKKEQYMKVKTGVAGHTPSSDRFSRLKNSAMQWLVVSWTLDEHVSCED
eukprot:scaffold471_cov318-Ochromonas_danica.AAC.38